MRGGRHGSRRGSRSIVATVLASLFLLVAVLVPVFGAQHADTASAMTAAGASGPGSTTGSAPNPIVSDLQYPYTGYLTAAITGISPGVITAGTGDVLTVTGTMTNASKGTLYDLRYVWQRGEQLAGVKAIKAEIAAPSRPSAVVGQDWKVLGPPGSTALQTDLPPGASSPFEATVAIADPDGLDLLQRGVYPLMIKVSGDVGQNGATQYERVGEIHLLATVLSLPRVPAGLSGAATSTTSVPLSGSAGPTGEAGQSGSSGESDTATATSTTDIPTQGFPTTQAAQSANDSVGGSAAETPAEPTQETTAETAPTASPTAVTGSTGAAGTAPAQPAEPVALDVLWPLVDRPHLGVDGIFLNDDLAKEIAPGGRLYNVLSGLTAVDTGPSTKTVVVDPELLAEIEQMAAGYRVVTTPGHPQAALTPVSGTSASTPSSVSPAAATSSAAQPSAVRNPPNRTAASQDGPRKRSRGSGAVGVTRVSGPRAAQTRKPAPSPTVPTSATTATTSPTSPTPTATTVAPPPPDTVAGAGQAAATTFLTTLRAALAGRQVLVLPYSDPDSVAMIRAGLSAQLATLITTGRDVAARVLHLAPIASATQPGLITTMSMPEGGFVDDSTLAFLSAHGLSQTLLSPATLRYTGGAAGAVTIDESANSGSTVKAAVTDAAVLGAVDNVVSKGSSAGLATRLNDLAALLTGGSLDGTGTPLIIAPDNRWTVNSGGLLILSSLLRTLEAGGVLTGTPLPTIADRAVVPATVGYPEAAQQSELDPGYLAAAARDSSWLSGMTSSLSRAAGSDSANPADLLDPLSAAMVSVGSTGLRSDDQVGHSILSTVESTLGLLQSGVTFAGVPSYTLAASTSPLLLYVRNDLPYVAKVRVRIVGGQAVGMTAVDPGVQSIPAGRSQQFKIATKVVKAGKFQVGAQLLAANGSPWSDCPATGGRAGQLSCSTAITVSSSAYGTLTIILIAAAGAALLLMVVIRIVQRLRGTGHPGSGAAGVGPADRARNPTDPAASLQVAGTGLAAAEPDPPTRKGETQ